MASGLCPQNANFSWWMLISIGRYENPILKKWEANIEKSLEQVDKIDPYLLYFLSPSHCPSRPKVKMSVNLNEGDILKSNES